MFNFTRFISKEYLLKRFDKEQRRLGKVVKLTAAIYHAPTVLNSELEVVHPNTNLSHALVNLSPSQQERSSNVL